MVYLKLVNAAYVEKIKITFRYNNFLVKKQNKNKKPKKTQKKPPPHIGLFRHIISVKVQNESLRRSL